MTISANAPVSVALPTSGADNGVWGLENNACLSLLQSALNQAIADIQDLQAQVTAANVLIAAITGGGGVNLTLLTADMLGVPGGIATLDGTGAVDINQVAFR